MDNINPENLLPPFAKGGSGWVFPSIARTIKRSSVDYLFLRLPPKKTGHAFGGKSGVYNFRHVFGHGPNRAVMLEISRL